MKLQKPKMRISYIKEIKTTFAGTLLIIFSCLDLWYFEKLEYELLGMPIQVLGIVSGLALWILPDSVVQWGKNKLDNDPST